MATPSWTLNGSSVRNPNTYKESIETVGNDLITLRGKRRRAIHSTKRKITVTWTILNNTEYQNLRAKYLTQDPYSVYYTAAPLTLNCTSGELNITDMQCYFDLEDREIIPSTDFLSNVSGTFLEV